MADSRICGTLAALGLWTSGAAVWGQSVVPNGAGTVVTNSGSTYEVTGGTLASDGSNLFHSFERFGLTAAESALFLTQPDILNVIATVTGGDASMISGQLGLTGSAANLFLLNPVGIVFGPEATLALPGDFHASTADGLTFAEATLDLLATPDYAELVGAPTGLSFRFSQPGSIVSAANLAVGSDQALTLTGGSVISTGSATGGEVALAALGESQLVRLSSEGSILSYEVAPDSLADGSLSPLSLPALLTGSGSGDLGLSVAADGTVTLLDGSVDLPTGTGTAIVNGSITAAAISLLGEAVGVVGSQLDASSPSGGGSVYIGGSRSGSGPLPNAQTAYISSDSVIDASAAVAGNGGTIIVWSDRNTTALGTLLARGGTQGGDGGFIETSGLQGLTLGSSAPSVAAPAGSAGLWLIDPFDITIGNFEVGNGFAGGSPFTAEASPALLDVGLLAAALLEGGTVEVNTGAAGNEAGNITLQDELAYFTTADDATLIFNAAGSIFINAPIGPATNVEVASQPLNVVLNADTNDTGTGQVVIDQLEPSPLFFSTISTNGGDLTARANSTNLTGVADTSAIVLADGSSISTFGFVNGQALSGALTLIGVSGDGNGISIEENSNIFVGNLTLNGASETGLGVLLNPVFASIDGAAEIVGDSTLGDLGIQIPVNLLADSIVLLSDSSDIEVGTLSATNEIEVTTPQFFRALNADANGVSIQSTNGPITITHGGNGLTPFEVGNTAENGTAGDIATGGGGLESEQETQFDNVIAAPQSYLQSFVQADISILTGSQPGPDPGPDPGPGPDPDPNPDTCATGVVDCNRRDRPNAPEPLSPDDRDVLNPRRTPEEAIDDTEKTYTGEFIDYLGLTEPTALPDLPQLQNQLALVAEATGIRPALIYFTFVDGAAATGAQPKQTPEVSSNQVLEIVVVTPEGPPTLKTVAVSESQLQRIAGRFRDNVTSPGRLRTTSYLRSAQQLYEWMIEPIEAELVQQEIDNLTFILPGGLRSLPVAAFHSGNEFLVERYSLGLMPSVSLTDLRYRDIRDSQVLAVGASDFIDQPELPAVPIELSTIANQLWPGEILLNETFTPARLVNERQQTPYGIVHLATHGDFNAGSVENSYIQFWDQRLGLDQIRSLQLNNPLVELMVLSACRTALGNQQAELGFAGMAVAAGVKTALASLWRVDDVATAGLMAQFYSDLQAEPIKAEALRQTQLAMLQGNIQVEGNQLTWEDGELQLSPELVGTDSSLYKHPYFWASFTTIGSPW